MRLRTLAIFFIGCVVGFAASYIAPKDAPEQKAEVTPKHRGLDPGVPREAWNEPMVPRPKKP